MSPPAAHPEPTSLAEIVRRPGPTLSVELFPAKTETARHQFERAVDGLAALEPDFLTVTYGAGGSSRRGTQDAVVAIQDRTGIPGVAHLTCVGNSAAELRELLDEYHAAGIRNLLALRGDPPRGQQDWQPTPGGLLHASDLIELIHDDGRFGIACAAFPEGHPQAPDRESDWGFLLGKFRAGAQLAATQCFFDVAPYRAMLEWTQREAGRPLHIEAGIIVPRSWPWCERFVERFSPGTTLPADLHERIAHFGDDEEAALPTGIAYATELCRRALAAGAPGLHLYALNRSEEVAAIVTTLRTEGLLPKSGA